MYDEQLAWVVHRTDQRGRYFSPMDPEGVGLRRMARLLPALGHPEAAPRVGIVHVAGTKGKGSTCAMLDACLRAGGLRSGLFTSPHLHSYRERMQVDGVPIAAPDLVGLIGTLRAAVEAIEAAAPELGTFTTFELTLALALLHFRAQQVDVAVLEAGLGGRLDATNAIRPSVAVVTSISLDHTRILGDTLSAIAAEKAAIFKPGVPAVASPQPPEAEAVMIEMAERVGAPLWLGGRDWRVEGEADDFAVEGPGWRHEHLRLGLAGRHQLDNAGTAVTALAAMRGGGLPLDADAIRRGLTGVRWPGRFETIAGQPTVILDGAHNVDSAERLAETVAARLPGRRVSLVFAASDDKDVPGMLRALARLAPTVIATQTHHGRAMAPRQVGQHAAAAGLPVAAVQDTAAALKLARATAGPDDVILVTGSLFLVAEAREVLGLADPEPLPPAQPG